MFPFAYPPEGAGRSNYIRVIGVCFGLVCFDYFSTALVFRDLFIHAHIPVCYDGRGRILSCPSDWVFLFMYAQNCNYKNTFGKAKSSSSSCVI
jgi:hypothetical protein